MSKKKNNKQVNKLAKAINKLAITKTKNRRIRKSKPQRGGGLLTETEYEARRFAYMMQNPCHASLNTYRPRATGSTNIQRLRTTFTLHATALNNAGTLIWFPEYHPSIVSQPNSGMSCFLAEYPAAVGAPFSTVGATNAAADYFGKTVGPQTTYTNWNSIITPEAAALSSSAYRDCMTLAACINIRYLGTTSANSGVINVMKNISPQMLFAVSPFLQTPAAGSTFPTISQFQSYSSQISRISLEGMELKWNNSNPKYRGLASNPTNSNIATGAFAHDALVTRGEGTLFGAAPGDYDSDSSGIGISWRGLNTATTGDIEIELVGVYEFRYAPNAGVIEQKPMLPPTDVAIARTQELLPSDWQFSSFLHQGGQVVSETLSGMGIDVNTAGRYAVKELTNAALGHLAPGLRRMLNRS